MTLTGFTHIQFFEILGIPWIRKCRGPAWSFGPDQWTFHISANRFLRGMVRLIVGMCIRVGQGKLSLEELRTAMDEQTRLPKPWSAPAEGLFLSGIRYPEHEKWEVVN